ncbi:hypothetical protein Tco_1291230, partial [Tanacetum coccineum]
STSGTGSLPSNTVANPKGELKAITTRSGLVLDGPTVPMPPPFINPEEDERVEETLTDPKHGEYNIKVPPPLVQNDKPPSQRNFVIHQRDPRYPHIPYPSRMNQEKQKEKDEMLKSLLSNKEKLIELANTPLNENCSAVILKKLPEKLGNPRKFIIPCGFSELKCKALADLDLTSPEVNDDIFDPEEDIIENLLNLDKTKDLPPYHDNPLSGNPTPISEPETKSSSSSPTLTSIEESDLIWEEFKAYLASDSFPPGNDDLPFDAESDLQELEYLLNHVPTKAMDSILEDSVDENSLDDNLVDTISEMFTDEHALDYSSPPLWDDYDDELLDLETVNDDTYDDPFYSKEEKIKDSKILIDELDLPRSSDFLPFPECDSVFYEDFSKVDALPSTNNEDKVFNPGILIHENLFEVTNLATPEKNVKKTTNASLILEDFNPPLYELPFHKEVLGLGALLSFSSENEEKVFNPGILTSKRVHTSLLPKLSHRDSKAFIGMAIKPVPDGDPIPKPELTGESPS